jgi:putative ubiquitin-RnfH superfamily antitoxin RatB of RatAB toxin-antitoxin module
MTRQKNNIISVVLATPELQQVLEIQMVPSMTAREVVQLAIESGLDDQGLDVGQLTLGIYGQRVADDYLPQPGDRIEIYRPLQQDPKELRRQQAAGPRK